MADATLDSIEDALFTALESLLKKNGGTVATVARYAGQVTAKRGVDDVTLGAAPALLLACPGGEASETESRETLLEGVGEVVDRDTWLVYVIVADARGDEAAVKGATGQSGLYRLISLVQRTLHGLEIDGLFQGHPVRYANWRWHDATVAGSQYVAVVRFLTDIAIDAPDSLEDATAQPLSIDARVQKRGGIEDAESASDVEFIDPFQEE